MAEYADAGYREPKSRFLYSLRENARYQVMMLAAAVSAMIYIFLTSGVSPYSLKGVVMAVAYCWGLIFAIFLMGQYVWYAPCFTVTDKMQWTGIRSSTIFPKRKS